jgi:hypothetical protein
VIVAIGADGVRLEEPDVLDTFHVAVRGLVDVDAELRGSGAGWVAGDGDARIAVDWVRGAATAAGVGLLWRDAFDDMVVHAATKGWLDADGSVIKAHVELT